MHELACRCEECEPRNIEGWRYWALVDAGYSHGDAAKIARDSTIDLHRAVELVEQGCDPKLASAIVL